jgi:NAD(P)-dependent dehydrogenase (short-subunit alcohol dehydrogenase family)
MNPGSLTGRTAVVTGSASGIGRATAQLLAKEGANLVLADIADAEGRQLADKLGNERCTFVRTDVCIEADIAASIQAALSKFGDLHCIVNCAAGGTASGPIEDLKYEDYRKGFDLLLAGPLFAIKYAVPVFKKQGHGAIVNIASLAGLFGVGLAPIYTAAKHGLIGLTKAAADQLAPFNIRVNVIAPGWIVTPMHRRGYADIAAADRPRVMRERFANKQPLQRAGEPEDIAGGVLYLLSDAARFVTGQTLVVDGGLSAVSRAFDEVRA